MPFSHQLTTVAKQLNSRQHIDISGLRGSAPALFFALLAGQVDKPLVIITEEYQHSLELSRDVAGYQKIMGFRLPQPPIINFPPLQRLPYQQVLPLISVEQDRIKALHRIRLENHYILFTSITALIDRMIDPSSFYPRFFSLNWGESINREQLAEKLHNLGYIRVPTVDEPGDFSIRGSIVDIFSPLSDLPLRLDFFGDEIESIRPFDPASQKSQSEELESLIIAPAHEILLPAKRQMIKERLKEQFISLNDPHIDITTIYKKLDQSPSFPGIDSLLPAIHPTWQDLGSYIKEATPVFINPPQLDEKISTLHSLLADAYGKTRERHKFAFPPAQYLKDIAGLEEIFPTRGQLVVHQDIQDELKNGKTLECNSQSNRDLRDAILRVVTQQQEGLFAPAAGIIRGWLKQKQQIVYCGKSLSGIERIKNLFTEYHLPFSSGTCPLAIFKQMPETGGISLLQVPLSQGTRLFDERIIILTETDIFGGKKVARTKARPAQGQKAFFDDFTTLKPGSYITHFDHGIGIYKGLQTLEVEGITNDYLILEYQGGDLIYVPVDRFNLIHAYHGSSEQPPKLTKLGSSQWDRVKIKARKAIDDFLVELIDLYASRQVEHGYAYPSPDSIFEEFEAGFAYEETLDQRQAISDVIHDMQTDRPMDRLICGDVGYGKTEVAIRAVFMAVTNGKQAAILVPTTILAQQHYNTFCQRFAPYPIVVEMLSRFKTPHEQREIIERLHRGTVDVIIGTHRLLQPDIIFKDLGLLVLDEEHKFGVRHKEKITSIKQHIDVLAMSATPIPRTLQMSLSGMRTMSAITTAPRDRLAVRTYIAAYDEGIIKEAVAKEIGRGGQIFFVHNSVKTIEAMAAHLRHLLPEIKLEIAHGQMKAAALEKVMMAFAVHEFDLLLCTTIIESGLDIPNANTMIINKAHKFGLAQLYQLRGRVGRSQKKAYTYLLVPALDQLPNDARRRLSALAEASDLGAGFRIAMQDLEIRGAGNLLGKSQSGHISAIGYELYQDLLSEAVAERRGEPVKKQVEPELKINLPAYIPTNYITDISLRLQTYKRVSTCADYQSLYELEDELLDRFGSLPGETQELFNLRKLKILLMEYHIHFFEVAKNRIAIHFSPESEPNIEEVMSLIQTEPENYQLTPNSGLISRQSVDPGDLFPWAQNLLQKIF